MKSAIVGILLFIFSLVTFQEATFYTLFKINQEYITSEYCINKDEPALQCHGTCHYQAQVKEASDEKADNPFAQFERVEILFVQSIEATIQSYIHTVYDNIVDEYIFIPTKPVFAIFHPPQY